MNAGRFFYEHPVFRHEEFVSWYIKKRPVESSSINMMLQYYLKTGRITRIRRELYASIPPGSAINTCEIDPYLIAGKLAPDSILAYHTALELHGIAYSAFGQFTYLTTHKNKSFAFQGQWFQAVTQPTMLKQQHKNQFAIQTINRQGLDIQITNLARTFVDILDRIDLSGSWEEVSRAANNMVTINIDEVIAYCLMLKNARLTAKVGYFLEQRQGAFAVNETQLQPLLDTKPKIPQYVSKRSQEKYQLIKKWNIFLPVSVVHQSWEEPHANI